VNFHECEHLSALDRAAEDDPALKAQRSKADEHAQLRFLKGNEFEAAYLEDLKRQDNKPGAVVEIAKQLGNQAKSPHQSLTAMQPGAEVIYQAAFVDGDVVGHATVPPERSIFLPISWRMCPDVCRFISAAVYDGRRLPEPMNARQQPEEALLQPAGEPVEARDARHRARRDRGQVPGPGGGRVTGRDNQ